MNSALRILTLTVAAFGAVPVLAQDAQMLGMQLRQLKSDSVLQGAYAACILGGGSVDTAVALFTDAGWTRTDEPEMGITELRSARTEVIVTLYDEGRICSVVSEEMGTERAGGALIPTIALADWQVVSADSADGCDAYDLGGIAIASVTSSGQDPVCYAENSSDVRFTFGP